MVVSVPGSWQQASKALVDASVMRAQQQSLVFTQWLWRAPGRGLVPERPGHDEKLGIFGPLNSSREGRGLEMGLMTPSQGSGSFRVVHPNSMGTLQPSPWASLPSSGCSSESFVTSFNELVNVVSVCLGSESCSRTCPSPRRVLGVMSDRSWSSPNNSQFLDQSKRLA